MNNIAYRSYRPPSIMELLQGVADSSPEFKAKSSGNVIGQTSRLRGNNADFNGQAIELTVPPSTRASRLYQFYTGLEGRLNQRGGHGFISYVYPSRSRGTAFTIKLKFSKNAEFLEALSHMPEVKKVVEMPRDDSVYPNISHKFNVLLAQ